VATDNFMGHVTEQFTSLLSQSCVDDSGLRSSVGCELNPSTYLAYSNHDENRKGKVEYSISL
jgi:hypothetical protein